MDGANLWMESGEVGSVGAPSIQGFMPQTLGQGDVLVRVQSCSATHAISNQLLKWMKATKY